MEGKYVHDKEGRLKMRGGRPSRVIKSKKDYNRKEWKSNKQ